MSLSADTGFQEFAKIKLQGIANKSIAAVLELQSQGATVPFIARYRKEKTGNLDEVQIRSIIEVAEVWQEIVKRKEFVLTEIAKQGSLTDDLKKLIEASIDLSEIEELYRPYKRKKKTKAKIAAEAGLEPLADWILQLGLGTCKETDSLEVKAKNFLKPDAGFATYEEVLRGAQHIIVEKLSSLSHLRALVKKEYFTNGRVVSEKTKEFKPNSKYSMYAEFSESVKSLQNKKSSHRYLALRRGWQEGELKVSIDANNDELVKSFEAELIKAENQATSFLKDCAKHALMIHVVPSVVNELHGVMKEYADRDAISVFAENVRKVLMSSPFGPKIVLGIDPGLRTGCKIALIDKSSKFVTHTVMQILGEDAKEKARKLFGDTLSKIKIEAIAVGNGTAGRETEKFVREVLKDINQDVPVVLVNESGASVYSASEVAREEFPDLDLTVRGAVSIARRLQDPLAELVKIEPKSIGVGQYQHDVTQNLLKKSLHDVVESCVNQVGVDVNTASSSLLQYVAGIGPAIARNIVQYRNDKGLFTQRSDLQKVSHLSSKIYEQAAGFLRVVGGSIPLDATGIHPERYQAVKDMLSEAGLPLSKVVGGDVEPLKKLREKWVQLVGEYTFDDIVTELAKPGRDPRDPYKIFKFREDIHEVKDLVAGQVCPGIVTNVTNFGAFVDIGVHQDGLVHISQLTHDFVDDPRLVVNPGDQITVKVIAVDQEKKQISLTMKLEERPDSHRPQRQSQQRGGSQRQQRDKVARGLRHDQHEQRDGGRRPQRDHGHRPQQDVDRRLLHDSQIVQEGSYEGRPRREDARPQNQGAQSNLQNRHSRADRDSRHGQQNHGQRPRKQQRSFDPNRNERSKPVFNNPFAALADLNNKKS